jgi:hypothetical protein
LGKCRVLGADYLHPDLHENGIGRALLDKAMTQFDAWGTRHVGLFTFAHSAKHVALYQKYGFWARFLTVIMSAPVVSRRASTGWSRFSTLNEAERAEAVRWCQAVADGPYAGLDLTEEIRATHSQGVGDTVLVEDAGGIPAFAVCHYGPRSEAGAGCCFIKFGAVRDGPSAEQNYLRLLDACEALAVAVGMPNLLAGGNMARHEAYRHLVERGFRTEIQGVAMHKGNDPGYCGPGAYIIDDWR